MTWWDPNNAGLSVGAAYRAINSPGTPWPGGPTAYAASLLDLSGNGNNLVEGAGAIPWAAATGWGFVAAANQWLDTGLIPASDQSWSMFIQYANVADLGIVAASRTPVGARTFGLRPDTGVVTAQYSNGNSRDVAPPLLAGNLGMGGAQSYRNGVAEGALIAAWTGAAAWTIWIGGRNNGGVLNLPITADIHAVVIYNGNAAAVQAEALAIVTAMAAL